MRSIKNITINKAIIHVLDNALDEPILNQRELYLTDDTLDFIGKHIAKVSADEEATYAKFNGENDVKEVCRKVIYEGDNFLEASKEIAEMYFNISRSSGLISSSDLLIVKFECEYVSSYETS